MRIGIIGAGAIGCLFAGLLANAGQEILLFTRRREVANRIQANGLQIEGARGSIWSRVKSVTQLQALSETEMAMIAVKSYETAIIARSIRPYLRKETALLTLQNGLDNLETIAQELPQARIIGGSTTMAARMLGDGTIFWGGEGRTILGDPRRNENRLLERLAKLFSASNIPTEVTSNLKQVLWEKALVSAGINPVTALLNLTNGELITNKTAASVASAAVREGEQVASGEGITFRTEPVEEMFRVASMTALNRSSMLQDMDNHRKTEIDAISGALVRFGMKHDLPTPFNAALWKSIESLEYMQRTELTIAVPARQATK